MIYISDKVRLTGAYPPEDHEGFVRDREPSGKDYLTDEIFWRYYVEWRDSSK